MWDPHFIIWPHEFLNLDFWKKTLDFWINQVNHSKTTQIASLSEWIQRILVFRFRQEDSLSPRQTAYYFIFYPFWSGKLRVAPEPLFPVRVLVLWLMKQDFFLGRVSCPEALLDLSSEFMWHKVLFLQDCGVSCTLSEKWKQRMKLCHFQGLYGQAHMLFDTRWGS